MKNKLLAVALCVCLTGSLLGCGGAACIVRRPVGVRK